MYFIVVMPLFLFLTLVTPPNWATETAFYQLFGMHYWLSVKKTERLHTVSGEIKFYVVWLNISFMTSLLLCLLVPGFGREVSRRDREVEEKAEMVCREPGDTGQECETTEEQR